MPHQPQEVLAFPLVQAITGINTAQDKAELQEARELANTAVYEYFEQQRQLLNENYTRYMRYLHEATQQVSERLNKESSSGRVGFRPVSRPSHESFCNEP